MVGIWWVIGVVSSFGRQGGLLCKQIVYSLFGVRVGILKPFVTGLPYKRSGVLKVLQLFVALKVAESLKESMIVDVE